MEVRFLIGVDIVDINRFKEVVIRTPRLLKRVFTFDELAYCQNKKNPYPSLAARFAAKESVRKLDSIFIKGVEFIDIEVIKDEANKPGIRLHNLAYDNHRDSGYKEINLSLSHTNEQAVAIAMMLKG